MKPRVGDRKYKWGHTPFEIIGVYPMGMRIRQVYMGEPVGMIEFVPFQDWKKDFTETQTTTKANPSNKEITISDTQNEKLSKALKDEGWALD